MNILLLAFNARLHMGKYRSLSLYAFMGLTSRRHEVVKEEERERMISLFTEMDYGF
jgi:hypothetical protein